MESDEVLYLEVLKGSKQAFEQLYMRYEGPLFGFIARRLNSLHDAEDIFHETMLTMFKGPKIERLNDGAVAAWLYKVAHNRILNRLRSRIREQRALDSYGREGECSPEAELWEDTEQLQELDRSAGRLTPPLAVVYHLRRQDKSYEDMATILGIPVGTVKSRLNAAVSQLRKDGCLC